MLNPEKAPVQRQINPVQLPNIPDASPLFFQRLAAIQEQQKAQQQAFDSIGKVSEAFASLMEKKRENDLKAQENQAMLQLKDAMLGLDERKQAHAEDVNNFLMQATPSETNIGGKAAVVMPGKSGPQVKFAPSASGLRGAGQPDDAFVSGADAQRYGVPANTTYGQLRSSGKMPVSEKSAAAIGDFDTALSQVGILQEKFNAARPEDSVGRASLLGVFRQGGAKLMPSSADGQYLAQAENISRLARSMGEKGVLTDQDVLRVVNALATFRDTKGSAQEKFDIIRDLIEEGQRNAQLGIKRTNQKESPDNLSSFLERKRKAGLSKEYAIRAAKEGLRLGYIIKDK